MDNQRPSQPFPPIQPNQPPQPFPPVQPTQPTQPTQPFPPIAQGQPMSGFPQVAPAQPAPAGSPYAGPAILAEIEAPEPLPEKKSSKELIKTIIIVALALALVTFIGLFIWIFVQNTDTQKNFTAKVDAAVASAETELSTKLEAEFAEREKQPYKNFSGPSDYGSLSFDYPKTWSVYIAYDAAKGGNFEAFLNPGEVGPTSNKDTVNALRVSILDKSFDNVVTEYQRAVAKKNSNLKVETISVNGVSASRYTGTIPKTKFEGVVVIFKIRDKTVILQTDAMKYSADFNLVVNSVKFNL